MRSRRGWTVPGFGSLVVALGCGAAPQAAPATVVVRAPEAAPTTVAPASPQQEDAPALPDAPAPGDVLAFARWRDPRRTVAAIAADAGVPSTAIDELAASAAPALVREWLGERVDVEPFAALVDWTAPIDVAVVTEGDPSRFRTRVAFSIGLRSLPQALGAIRGKIQKRAEGYWPIDAVSGDEPVASPSCGVFAAAGRAPARLVCGDRSRDVSSLGPYLVTTFARRSLPGGDLHGEVHLRPLLDKVGPGLAAKAKALPLLASSQRIGVPSFDDALMEAASALAVEAGHLLTDLDAFEFDAGYDATEGVRVEAKASFADATSWTVQRLVDAPSPASGAPAIVGHAPKSATSVAYGHAGDPAAFAGVTRVLRGLLEGQLTSASFGSAADRRAIASLIRVTGGRHSATVSAQGRFSGSASLGSLQEALAGLVGWYLIGRDEEPGDTVAWLRDLVAAYNRPAVQRWFKSLLKSDAKFLPTLKVVPAPKALGVGALDVELRVADLDDPLATLLGGTRLGGPADPSGATRRPRGAVSVHLLVMGDAGRTWIGFAAEREKLADLMARTKGKLPGPDAIANESALQPFLREAHRSSAYVTLRGTLGIFDAFAPMLAVLPGDAGAVFTSLVSGMQQMPNGGSSPITLSSDVQSGARPRLSFAFRLPKGTVQDFGSLVRHVLSSLGPMPSLKF